jgi:hypothetical protein
VVVGVHRKGGAGGTAGMAGRQATTRARAMGVSPSEPSRLRARAALAQTPSRARSPPLPRTPRSALRPRTDSLAHTPAHVAHASARTHRLVRVGPARVGLRAHL